MINLQSSREDDDPCKRILLRRVLYLISPLKHVVEAVSVYPDNLGRNFCDVLRLVEGVQLICKNNMSIGFPADWKCGDNEAMLIEKRGTAGQCE